MSAAAETATPTGPVHALGLAQAAADGRAPRGSDAAWGAHAFVLVEEAGALVQRTDSDHGPAFSEAAALVAACRADWEKRPINPSRDTDWARKHLSALREIGFGIYGRPAR